MKRPLAYVTAPWSGDVRKDAESAVRYCRQVYEAGYSPICPVLFLPLFLKVDMARQYLRRSQLLVVCGSGLDESVKNDIAVAERLHIVAATLDGILNVKGQGRAAPSERREGGMAP